MFSFEWKKYKKARLVVSHMIGMKFGMVALQVSKHRLTKSDFKYEVILSRWRP